MKFLIRIFTVMAMFVATSALAHDYTAGAIKIDHPWSRATVPGIPNGVAYFVLQNTSDTDDRLLSASSPVAKSVELHTHIKDGDVLRMRHVDDIVIPAGQTVALEPGGLHVMLMGLHQALEKDSSFPMTLEFENAGSVTVDVQVQLLTRSRNSEGDGGTGHNSHDHGSHDHDDDEHGDHDSQAAHSHH